MPVPAKRGPGPLLVKPDLDKIAPPPLFFTFFSRRSRAKYPGKIEAGPRPLSKDDRETNSPDLLLYKGRVYTVFVSSIVRSSRLAPNLTIRG